MVPTKLLTESWSPQSYSQNHGPHKVTHRTMVPTKLLTEPWSPQRTQFQPQNQRTRQTTQIPLQNHGPHKLPSFYYRTTDSTNKPVSTTEPQTPQTTQIPLQNHRPHKQPCFHHRTTDPTNNPVSTVDSFTSLNESFTALHSLSFPQPRGLLTLLHLTVFSQTHFVLKTVPSQSLYCTYGYVVDSCNDYYPLTDTDSKASFPFFAKTKGLQPCSSRTTGSVRFHWFIKCRVIIRAVEDS